MTYFANIKSNLLTKVMIMAMGFISSILTARALGAEQKGVLVFAWTWFVFVASFGHLGLNNVIIYFYKKRKYSYADLVRTNVPFLVFLAMVYGGALMGLKATGIVPETYSYLFLAVGAVFIGIHFIKVFFRAFYIAEQDLVSAS